MKGLTKVVSPPSVNIVIGITYGMKSKKKIKECDQVFTFIKSREKIKF